jgi:hypothetical protein
LDFYLTSGKYETNSLLADECHHIKGKQARVFLREADKVKKMGHNLATNGLHP